LQVDLRKDWEVSQNTDDGCFNIRLKTLTITWSAARLIIFTAFCGISRL